MKYAIVIENQSRSFGAYVPDLPDRVAVAKTRSRVIRLIEEAISLHLGDVRSRGDRILRPSTHVECSTMRCPRDVYGINMRNHSTTREPHLARREYTPGRTRSKLYIRIDIGPACVHAGLSGQLVKSNVVVNP